VPHGKTALIRHELASWKAITPDVFEEGGYSDEEVGSLVHVLDRVVEEKWAARRTG
jgi:hypothetical protein